MNCKRLNRAILRSTRLAIAVGSVLFGSATSAQADWFITTYNQVVGNPEITSMAIADQYFTGARPQRFTGMSTISIVDLFENGGAGQFTINNPFPGLDNMPTVGDTNDYTARVSGTLVVNTAGPYDFFTDSDDGNRFLFDLNQNGIFEASESIVPDGGLQGAGTPERSAIINLTAGNYPFEVSFFERGGGASIDAGYRVNGAGTQFVLGNSAGGIGITGPATVKTVGAATGGGGPDITNFAQADALRSGPNEPGFPVSALRDVFNIVDSGGDADFPGGQGAPGLGAPNANDDDDFLVVGTGFLVIQPGQTGGYVFRSNTDDGGRLKIDLNDDGDFNDAGELVINRDVLQGPTNTDSGVVNFPTDGFFAIEYSFFERGGGAEGEVSARPATGTTFTLLGDTANGGLDVVTPIPEPSTYLLAGLGVIGTVAVLRRRKQIA